MGSLESATGDAKWTLFSLGSHAISEGLHFVLEDRYCCVAVGNALTLVCGCRLDSLDRGVPGRNLLAEPMDFVHLVVALLPERLARASNVDGYRPPTLTYKNWAGGFFEACAQEAKVLLQRNQGPAAQADLQVQTRLLSTHHLKRNSGRI
jgi:hypothetical protein